MKKIKAYFEDLDASVISTRRVMFLETLVALLLGIIIGILIAPPRKLKMGCNNGNNNVADGCGCGNGRCCGDEDDDTENDEDKREND
ncbi:MAG: hypothetical protein IJM34_06655 [Lachnospiraceae bacterium]|nr:hypothetical protein [Lachnospiraceae bacterium]